MGLALHETVLSVHLDAIKLMYNEMTSWSMHFSFFTKFLVVPFLFESKHVVVSHSHIDI